MFAFKAISFYVEGEGEIFSFIYLFIYSYFILFLILFLLSSRSTYILIHPTPPLTSSNT